MAECHMECVIRTFVLEKTAENVELSLTKDICIRHVKKKGSILLAIFWVKILQHPRNFPITSYQYKKVKNQSKSGDLLQLPVQDMLFTVYMGTGKLLIQGGDLLYEWFKKNFIQLFTNYDSDFIPDDIPKPQVVREIPTKQKEKIKSVSNDTEDYLLMLSRKHSLDIPGQLEEQIHQRAEELINGMEDITITKLGVWEGENLDAALEGLDVCSVKDGFSFIYRAWKSLLNKWFTQRQTQVYIVTPIMDTRRLKDIVDIFLLSRNIAHIATFFVRKQFEDFNERSFVKIKRDVMFEYEPKYHPVIDYKIFRQISYPWKPFNASFIAGVKDGQAQVLTTSARFHGKHFTTDNMESVCLQTMSEDKFIKQFVRPIAGDVIVMS